jgi:metal-responsive CopG/Arc/MetJ family transcriptional regulator
MARHTVDPIVKETVRTHVVLPPELVEEVDRRVGPRRRSQFFADAAVEKLARLKLAEAAQKAAGSLANVATPGWETPESTANWVRSSRQKDDERRSARLKV